MTWQSNLLRYLEKLDLGDRDAGWVEHRTYNGWEMLCHYWTYANPERLIKLIQAVIDYDKKAREYHYYLGIGCDFPVQTGPHHKRKHYFSIHRYPKDAKKHEKKQMARLMKRIKNAD